MAYQVSILPRAARDLRLIYMNINAEHSRADLKWYQNLTRSLRSLKEHPTRCPITRENHELRHMLFGNKPHIYRVIFRVIQEENYVGVLHVRHSARRDMRSADLM